MSTTFTKSTPDGLFEIATSGEGEHHRDRALANLETHRADYIRRARRAFLRRCLAAGSATADDVRAVVELPPGTNPNLFGAVPTIFARQRIVQFDGFDTSRRAARHAGLNRVWRLVDRDAAERWLAAHPDPPAAPTANDTAPPAGTGEAAD